MASPDGRPQGPTHLTTFQFAARLKTSRSQLFAEKHAFQPGFDSNINFSHAQLHLRDALIAGFNKREMKLNASKREQGGKSLFDQVTAVVVDGCGQGGHAREA